MGRFLIVLALAVQGGHASLAADDRVGQFEGHGDVGTVLHPGSVKFDESSRSYTVTGSGANMWFATDAFQLAWTRVSGDVAIAADIAFQGAGKDPHRKAVLMIRQSLDADAAYVDAAIHGDGLTSLQFRAEKGANTHEVQSNVTAPTRASLERRGQYVLLYLAPRGEPLKFSGAAVRIALDQPVYVGIGVCAHNKDAMETRFFHTPNSNRWRLPPASWFC